MSQNRRSFLRRGLKLLAIVPVAAAVAAKSNKAEAGLLDRVRCRTRRTRCC